MDRQAIGRRIKYAREEVHMTQETLAEKIGCTPQHVSAMERGVKIPKLETFVAIANVLNVSTDLLLQDVLDGYKDGWEGAVTKTLAPMAPNVRRYFYGILKQCYQSAEWLTELRNKTNR